MVDHEAVCVLVPALNEAETIGRVVSSFRDEGFEHVLVVDGGSTDGTRERAESAGARVIEQSGTGKGQAVREGIRRSEKPVILLLDGDWTYRVEDAEAMLEPIFAGRAEHVIGDRFADMEPGAMTRLNRVGNRIINRAFRWIHGRDLRDILSGYRAFTRESVERLTLTKDGFGVETQMAAECVKHNVRTEVVPIRYRARPDASETNLHPLKDGAVIVLTLYQMAKTNNPLFYFGSVGIVSTITGVGLGAWVAVEWITRNVSHEVIAVVSAFAIMFGFQLLMFGVLSDMIVTVNREQTRRMEEIANRLGGRGPRTDYGGTRSPAERDAGDGDAADRVAGDGDTVDGTQDAVETADSAE